MNREDSWIGRKKVLAAVAHFLYKAKSATSTVEASEALQMAMTQIEELRRIKDAIGGLETHSLFSRSETFLADAIDALGKKWPGFVK
jgi:uncharacterized protein YfiM (DUF2279 family)